MQFRLEFTKEASASLKSLEAPDQKAQLEAVRKCLGFLETNPHHGSLRSKKFETFSGPNGEKVFESYAQQNRPGAYRVFWYYSKEQDRLIIVSGIVPHL